MALKGSQGIELELAAGTGGGSATAGDGLEQDGDEIRIPEDMWYRPEDYGAVRDGVTNDGPAFNAMIAAMPATGGKVLLTAGVYIVNTTIVVNKPVFIDGAGSSVANLNLNSGSVISTALDGLTVFDVQESFCKFSNFSVKNTNGGTMTSGAAFAWHTNPRMAIIAAGPDFSFNFTMDCVCIDGFYDQVSATNAAHWNILSCRFRRVQRWSIDVGCTSLPDWGDSCIIGCDFTGREGGSLAAIHQINSGGLKIISNKFNYFDGKFAQMYDGNLAGTSDLLICNNSFENFTSRAIIVQNARNVTITGNQIAQLGGPSNEDILIYNGDGVSITGNTFNKGGSDIAIKLYNVPNVSILNSYRDYINPVVLEGVTNYYSVTPKSIDLNNSDAADQVYTYHSAGTTRLYMAAWGTGIGIADLRNRVGIGPGTPSTEGIIVFGTNGGLSGMPGWVSIRGGGYGDAAENMRADKDGIWFIPMTAAAASAIVAPADGRFVYVNTTNATFTSVGFWARENGVWVKQGNVPEAQGLQDVIDLDNALDKDNSIDMAGHWMSWDVDIDDYVFWGPRDDTPYPGNIGFEAFFMNPEGGYGSILSDKYRAAMGARNGITGDVRGIYIDQTEIILQSDRYRFRTVGYGYATGPGYVWTDVAGDGVMTLQPPTGGGGGGDDMVQTLTDAATIAFNVALGKSAMVTVTASRTLDITNFGNGQVLSLLVKQSGAGAKTLTLPAGTMVLYDADEVVELTDDPTAHDIITFWKIDNTIYANIGKDYGEAGAGGGGGGVVDVDMSLEETGGVVTLVNDEEAPGNNKVYGTDAAGAKGFQDLAVIDNSDADDGDAVIYRGGIYKLEPGWQQRPGQGLIYPYGIGIGVEPVLFQFKVGPGIPAIFDENAIFNANVDINNHLQVAGSTSQNSVNIGGLGILSHSQLNSGIDHNAYYNGSSWRYREDGEAVLLQFYQGMFAIHTAPAGVAGAAITWVNLASWRADGLVTAKVHPEYADNAAALAGGLPLGTYYRTGDIVKQVH